jgi:hypothetical protein
LDGDLLVFDSCNEAESWMESPDVEEGEYIAGFDAVGTRFAIDVPEPTRRSKFLGVTTLKLTPVRMQRTSAPGAAAPELTGPSSGEARRGVPGCISRRAGGARST